MKARTKWTIRDFAGLLLLLLLAASPERANANPPRCVVELFDQADDEYGGGGRLYRHPSDGGNASVPGGNDDASMLRFTTQTWRWQPSGYRYLIAQWDAAVCEDVVVVLFEDSGYAGRPVTLTSQFATVTKIKNNKYTVAQIDLGGYTNFDDKTSSHQVWFTSTGDCMVCVHPDTWFSTAKICHYFRDGDGHSRYDIPVLGDHRFVDSHGNNLDWDDRISSVSWTGSSCSADLDVFLYTDDHYGGGSLRVPPGDAPELGNYGWNDAASSVQFVFFRDTTPPVMTLNGPAEIVLQYLQEPYVDQGANSWDDGTVPCGVSIDYGTLGDPANPNPGYHTITYTSADMAGNFAPPVTRSVIVVRPVLHTFQSTGAKSALDLSVGGDGTFYTIAASRGYILAGLFGNQTEIVGMLGASRIDGAPGGMAWVVKDDGSVHTLNPNRTWTQAHNSFITTDIGVGANGTMKLVDDQGMVHAFNVGGVLWQDVPTAFFVSKIAVDANGYAWVANSEGVILLEVDGGWQHLDVNGPRARDLDIAPDGSLWIIAFDGLSIHQFKHDGTGWQPEYYLGGVEAASITVDASGNPWFLAAADGSLYSW